jgi:hypothetical protein
MTHTRQFRAGLRRYLSRQKQKLSHRVIYPARYLGDLAQVKRAASGSPNAQPIRMALLSDKDAYCSEEQFHPFFAYRSELRDRLKLTSLHMLLGDALRAGKLILPHFDVIGLKMSYRTEAAEALQIARAIRDAAKDKRIIYFDGDDDVCVQWPEILPYVDLYVKKHVFRDRRNYLKRFAGKSNLHDYVHNKYGHVFTSRDYGNPGDKYTLISGTGPVPIDQIPKISVGYNVALDSIVTRLFDEVRHQPPRYLQPKPNDITFRGSAPSVVWMYHLRKNIEPTLRRLEMTHRVVISNARVTPDEYYRELTSSKICISPFGYGEICWRDFEAVLCGSLVIKPDIGHVESNPDIFRPYETYVPVKWDFSDLEEKCAEYLADHSKRQRVVARAFEVLDDFYKNDGFVKSVSDMLYKLDKRDVMTSRPVLRREDAVRELI